MRAGREKTFTCGPHTRGVGPETAPFFHPDCRTCKDKLARGLVTGLEPVSPRGGHGGPFGRGLHFRADRRAVRPHPR